MSRTRNCSAILLSLAGFAFSLLSLSRANGEDTRTPVVIYDTHGSVDEVQWTRVAGNLHSIVPEHAVLQNGLIRICYPARKADPRSGFNPLSERAAHLLFLNTGGTYQLVQDADFGDWTYVGGPFDDAPTGFQIVKNTPEECSVTISFHNHKMTAADSEKPGADAAVTKTVTLRQGEFGYVARLRVGSGFQGEREVGFGGTRTHLFNYTASAAQQWQLGENQFDGCCNYKFPKQDGVAGGDSWAVGFAPGSNYYRLVAISPAGPSATAALRFAQFRTVDPSRPNTAGSIIHYTRQPLQEYEAYIAAVPYDATGATLMSVTDSQFVIQAAAEGVYSVFSRSPRSDPDGKSLNSGYYAPAFRELRLVKGLNRIPKGAEALVEPVVVPVSNGVNFPADIAAIYNRNRN